MMLALMGMINDLLAKIAALEERIKSIENLVVNDVPK